MLSVSVKRLAAKVFALLFGNTGLVAYASMQDKVFFFESIPYIHLFTKGRHRR